MTIVVGIDESESSSRGLRRAIELAESLQSELHVVHAVHIPGTLLAVLNQVPADIVQLEKAQRDSVWANADPILEEASTKVTRVDLTGYPADALVEYAEGVGAELIVIGTRGRGELAALFLGSTSHRILHLAHCDVLVVKGG
ncbi:MAG: universal stress protein [Acidimicrobiia bacterium]|nr:universal stress protein [Acidimicrobiia bacterium]MDH3399079.1 universal stress protein [Acidimicrobiia bacterium]MDH5615992.1 universal stress protein [Acidimicrobiia bacterium]